MAENHMTRDLGRGWIVFFPRSQRLARPHCDPPRLEARFFELPRQVSPCWRGGVNLALNLRVSCGGCVVTEPPQLGHDRPTAGGGEYVC